VKHSVANPDRIRLAKDAMIADINIVISCGQIDRRVGAKRNVAATSGVVKERKGSIGGIVGTRSITKHSSSTDGSVLV